MLQITKELRLFSLGNYLYKSYARLFGSFSKICQTKTTIFITHRLTSIKMVDKVLILDQGRQVAWGTHEALLSGCSLYKEMFESQARHYVALANRFAEELYSMSLSH